MHVQVVAGVAGGFPQEHAYCYPWINFSYRDALICVPWLLVHTSHIKLIMALRKMALIMAAFLSLSLCVCLTNLLCVLLKSLTQEIIAKI